MPARNRRPHLGRIGAGGGADCLPGIVRRPMSSKPRMAAAADGRPSPLILALAKSRSGNPARSRQGGRGPTPIIATGRSELWSNQVKQRPVLPVRLPRARLDVDRPPPSMKEMKVGRPSKPHRGGSPAPRSSDVCGRIPPMAATADRLWPPRLHYSPSPFDPAPDPVGSRQAVARAAMDLPAWRAAPSPISKSLMRASWEKVRLSLRPVLMRPVFDIRPPKAPAAWSMPKGEEDRVLARGCRTVVG